MTFRQRIEQLEEQHGGLRKAARALKIDPAYLYRLKTGEKIYPSSLILRKLGLKRVIRYYLNGGKK